MPEKDVPMFEASGVSRGRARRTKDAKQDVCVATRWF